MTDPADRGRGDAPDVSRAYDRWAATYDADTNATRDLDASVLRRAGPDPTDRDVLELGCGTGKNTAWLVEHARRVVGIDFSDGMLAQARARITARNAEFVRQDVREPLAVPDASFDLVIANLILEHVECVGPVFREAARVLRPGGRFFMCELHPMRQLRGGQAHFTDAATGDVVYVAAFVHSQTDYVTAGIEAGLSLERVGEWSDEQDAISLPRLFSATFLKAG